MVLIIKCILRNNLRPFPDVFCNMCQAAGAEETEASFLHPVLLMGQKATCSCATYLILNGVWTKERTSLSHWA